jgi:iron complex transport system substrate-binding protein
MADSKNVSMMTAAILLLLCTAALFAGCTNTIPQPVQNATTKAITDMTGRTLEVPQKIDRVLTTVPMTTIAVYALAPEKLIGVNFEPNKINGKVYMPEKYLALPNVGGWFGKQTGNYEVFISMDPDIIIEGEGLGNFTSTIQEHQQQFGAIPVVGVLDARNASAYDESIKYLGTLLGADTKAAELLEFYHRVLDDVGTRVSAIPADQRVRVYYAEGPKGLQTDPTGSVHSELIELAGGINVADCQILPGMGMTPVSMEHVTKWNPEVIIVSDPVFYSAVYNDTLWQSIPAVQHHRVYLVPQSPYPWFDRPPGINRIIGIPWTAKVLYPDTFSDVNLPALTKEFYLKFYHFDLSDNELDSLLDPSLR